MLHIRELPVRQELLESRFSECESLDNLSWDRHMTFSTPLTNILEIDDAYVLEVALPGVVLDDIDLKIEGPYLTLMAKRTPHMFEERALYLRQEMPTHYLIREFEFEDEIIEEEIEARLDRGILFISVPKFETARRIPVSAGKLESSVGRTRVSKSESRKVSVK